MNGGPLVESLQAAAASVTIPEGPPHALENRLIRAQGFADDQRPRILQGHAYRFPTGHLSNARVSGVVGQNDDVAGKVRAVGAAEIEEHAVMTGYRHYLHCNHNGGAGDRDIRRRRVLCRC